VPESCRKQCPSNDEGAGNAGRQPHPQPCVRMEEAHKQVTTGQPLSPAFPARWFATYSVLSPVRPGFVVTVASRKIRKAWHLHRGAGTTRLRRPRWHRSSRNTTHVHRIPPRVRDDASAPHSESGWREVSTISEKKKEKSLEWGSVFLKMSA